MSHIRRRKSQEQTSEEKARIQKNILSQCPWYYISPLLFSLSVFAFLSRDPDKHLISLNLLSEFWDYFFRLFPRRLRIQWWQSSKRLSKHEDACAASFIHDYGYAYVLSAATADISHNCPRSIVHFVFFSSFLFDRESRHSLPIRIPLKHNKRSISQLIAVAKKLHLWLPAEAASSNPGWHTLWAQVDESDVFSISDRINLRNIIETISEILAYFRAYYFVNDFCDWVNDCSQRGLIRI
jgi:hypothetical protein